MIFAYIDPGAGSMVIQMLIAAAVAVPFFLRTQISQLVTRFRGRGQAASDKASTQTEGHTQRDA